MSNVYDNWERLVRAVRKREEFRELARAPSRGSSLSSVSTDFSSRFSFHSPVSDHFRDRKASSSSSIAFYRRYRSGESLPSPKSEDGIVRRIPQLRDWPRPISFNQLKKACRKFQPSFILGEELVYGSVYKGWIEANALSAAKPGCGMAVTIWRSWSTTFQDWSIKVNYNPLFCHPNLITIIAYCETSRDLFLVYEFTKGSLYNHLFRNGYSLSWTKRIKMANGVAQGLSFLHDAQVLHRNLRSSNILLDEEFNAKLSDFGYARKISSPLETPLGVCYGSPEYNATGDWTEKCDVYAFGIVLLELLTGCSATEIRGCLAPWKRSFLYEKKSVCLITDPRLEGNYPLKEAQNVAAIAFHCTSHIPKERPRMKDVLIALTQHEI